LGLKAVDEPGELLVDDRPLPLHFHRVLVVVRQFNADLNTNLLLEASAAREVAFAILLPFMKFILQASRVKSVVDSPRNSRSPMAR
jgi:hypothetical protein